MIKVMTIFGTRPEAIKMAPIVLEMLKRKTEFEPVTVITGQHKEMLAQVMKTFNIVADYNLDIMEKDQTLTDISSKILNKLNPIIVDEKPDIILVHGDTSTTFAAALTAFFNKVPIGHVEAGLRTWNKYSPFPEEMNRQLTDTLTDIYFAPTEVSRNNLLKENKNANAIVVTGNTAIDALKTTVNAKFESAIIDGLELKNKKMILLTMHRRENQGKNMRHVFSAVNRITNEFNDVEVVYPVHLSPVVQKIANESFSNNAKVHLIKPLDVLEFHNMMSKAFFVMSDSGGVQEEAPALKKPVLVLRDTTERPEGVDAGTLKLVGTNEQVVYEEIKELLVNRVEYEKMANAKNPYGNGKASEYIMNSIKKMLG